MNVALVDDNKEEEIRQTNLLKEAFQNTRLTLERFDVFSCGEEFFKNWIPGTYDLVVLDILMGEDSMTGIDVAKKIREYNPDVRIVFCSTSNEYAIESYSVNASYYLQKPATVDSVTLMINRLNMADYELRRFVVLPDNQRLLIRNILYTEYYNHKITVYQKNKAILETWISQNDFEKLLLQFRYIISVSKGVMVNLYEVSDMKDGDIYMSDGRIIGTSRRNRQTIEKAYSDFIFHNVRNIF